MAKARLLRPNREQCEMVVQYLDSLIDPDHPARTVWAFAHSCDLSEFIRNIRSVESGPGRSAIDPHLLFALWLYAYTQGVGSARHIEVLCKTSADYQWLCGGVCPCHKTLSSFRASDPELLERILTHSIAALTSKSLIQLDLVTLDGVRVRASAGASSFRREETLRQKLEEATALVSDLSKDAEDTVSDSERKQRKRRSRAAQERKERIEEALQQLRKPKDSSTSSGGNDDSAQEAGPGAQEDPSAKSQASTTPEAKQPQASTKDKPKQPRASTTDPEARIMKMADGGFRPAFNVQVICEKGTALILGLKASQLGNDGSLLPTMVKQFEQQYGIVPRGVLVDGGYTQGYKAVEETLEWGCEVFGPPKTVPEVPRSPSARSRAKKKPETIKAWEERIEREENKAIRRQRGQVAEYCNARLRAMSGYQLSLRGAARVESEMILRALAHNMQVIQRKWGVRNMQQAQ